MNYFFFVLKSALVDFSRNKGRTFLTSLGILIGVLSVVLLVAFGLGLKKYIEDQFESLGTNNIRVFPGNVIQNGQFRGGASIASVSFDEKDYRRLLRVRDTEYVVPIFTRGMNFSVGKENEYSDIYSSSADIFPALNLVPEYGRAFSAEDVDKRSKVAVIGPKLAEKLFKSPALAVNRTIKTDSLSLKVIGVLESKGGGGFGGPDFDSFVYVPYTTGYVFNTDKKFVTFIVKTISDTTIEPVKRELKRVLDKYYEEDEYSLVEQTEILNAVSSIFSILNTVLIAIAAISLVVGGIGIMNIMYVSVTERIKEIGIRRAIGARKGDILIQFLLESVILSVFGGLMGLGLAYIIVYFIQSLFPAYIDTNSVLLALGVSSGIGVIFGVFPAKKAADLSPIDAIRYE